ncbi:hypothetical protein [Streptomyces alfalfae]
MTEECQIEVCTECGSDFTDERWQATECVGWGKPQESRPALRGNCEQRHEIDWKQAWPGVEQDQAVPEQKAARSWLSRFRR